MLVAIVKDGWKGRAKGTYMTMDESEATPLIAQGIAYDGAAFAQLTTGQKNAVYARAPTEKNLSDLDKWLFAL